MASDGYGACKLTGFAGKYVRSHILPKALTRASEPGLPFVQGGVGFPATRRWDSWYDCNLVIRKGEAILAELDSWSIRFLRENLLVWSGWGQSSVLPCSNNLIDEDEGGFRVVGPADFSKLRVFFLSILWRAAASTLREMGEISLSEADVATLGMLVVAGDPGPPSFFPIQLAQLSTRGEAHNHSPILTTKFIPDVRSGFGGYDVPVYRFYFDGLIAHFHLPSTDTEAVSNLGNLVVGQADTLTVVTVPYGNSFQKQNLDHIIFETEHPQ